MTRTKTLAGLFAVFALCASWSANAATLSPSTVTFGATKLSTASAASTLTFTNNSDVLGATINSVAISGTNAGDYSIDASSTCQPTTSVAFNGTCTVKVIFTPQVLTTSASGPRTATVTVASSSLQNPSLASTLSGTSPAPTATVSASSLSFDNQVVNTTSAAKTYTLSNGGGVNDLTGVSIALDVNTIDFAHSEQTANCGGTVAAGSSCTISVTFTPTTAGARTGSVVVTAPNSNATTQLTGNGITPPMLALSPTSLTFTNQTAGSTSAAKVVTLSNNGQSPLTVSSITLAGSNASDFAQTNTCSSPVAAGGNCTINVTFTPTATGTRSASVVVSTDGGNGNVALSGTGIAQNTPAVTLSPASLNFPNQTQNTTSAAQTVTLTNSGNATLSVGTISVSGTNASEFAQTNNCPAMVAAGNNCAINVTFTPTSIGNRSATLNINSNASSSPDTVSLSGTTASASKTVTLPDGRIVTLLSSQGSIDSLAVATTPTSGLPASTTYPVGFFNYQVSGVTAGATVTFSYVLPVGVVVNTYVKCVAGTCSPLAGTNVSADGRTVTFTIQDNGPNDSNATAGIITDPGAPAFIANTNPTATATTGSSSSGAMGWETLLLMGVPALLRSRRRKLH